MEISLIIVFLLTLIYLVTTGRINSYILFIGIQGIVLFFLALLRLKIEHYYNLIFILVETLVFKGVIVPLILYRLAKRNKVIYELEPNSTNFSSIVFAALIIIVSFLLSSQLHVHAKDFDVLLFTASISAIFCGAFVVISRKKILTHIIGYMILENGLFLISLSIGSELPIVVNLGILFDIITTVLLLGVFVNEMSKVFKGLEINKLNSLKD
jgi:hydrogenase-4 component E